MTALRVLPGQMTRSETGQGQGPGAAEAATSVMSAAALKRRRKREAARKAERGDEAEVPAPPSPHPAEPDLAQGRANPEATPPPSPIAGVPCYHDEASEDAEEEGPRLCGISELPCPAAIPHVPITEPYISVSRVVWGVKE